jgi:hypothetical protein
MPRRLTPLSHAIALVGASLIATACNPYQCTYETRFVGTDGTTTGANGTLIVTYVNFRQYHDDGPVPSDLTWNIRGEGLASPATGLALRNANGQSVLSLSMSSTSAVSMTATSAATITGADRDRMFELLGSGAGVVVLTLQNGGTITVPLRVASQDDWHHPECD